jgi:hypothetical protein
MGWGILESTRAAFPRGTSLVGVVKKNDGLSDSDSIKGGEVVARSPEPSDDPNDPLNW